MGIGRFRREVQRWLNGALFSAQQDAESASRMPTDVDPVGIIDLTVVDAVEESLAEPGSSSRANTIFHLPSTLVLGWKFFFQPFQRIVNTIRRILFRFHCRVTILFDFL